MSTALQKENIQDTSVTHLRASEIVVDCLRPEQITAQMQLIERVMKDNMIEGVDYGKIPGCGPKPTLFKAGAEKLRLLFFLSPQFDWASHDLGGGHVEIEFSCTVTQIHTGKIWGQGVGSASTMESKYRYRNGKENPDIADLYNTVRKMAKKRSFVDAILTATSASSFFTQDVEDKDQRGSAREGTAGQAGSTNMIVPPDSEGVQVWRSTVAKVSVKSGFKKDNQPWYRTSLLLPGDTMNYWVSTFDRNLGKKAATFEGKACDLTVRKGVKEGTWDLLDIVEAVETAAPPPEENGNGGDQEEFASDAGFTEE